MTSAEKRQFLERPRQYVLYDVLQQEDCDRIYRIYAEALQRAIKKEESKK